MAPIVALGEIHQEKDQRLHERLCDDLERLLVLHEVGEVLLGLGVDENLQLGERRERVEGKSVDERALLEGGLEDVVDARGLEAVAGRLLQL